MDKVTDICPDSSSGFFCYLDVLNQIPDFCQYCSEDNISFKGSQWDFDGLYDEYFFLENSEIKAFCHKLILTIKIFDYRIVIDNGVSEIIEYDDVLKKADTLVKELICKNVFLPTQINYHAINLIEDIYKTDEPYMIFNIFARNIIFDKNSDKVILLSSDDDFAEDLKLIKKVDKKESIKSSIIKNTKKDYFIGTVKQAKEDIRNGEVFQIVLSQIIELKSNINLNYLFYEMRSKNQSEYSIVINQKDKQIICFSPETLIKRCENVIKTYPIAGTYRVSDDEDITQKKIEILKDRKEISEHVMLVDLARNDLGRISKPGSVKFEVYLQIKVLYNLIHIYSVVIGEVCEQNVIKSILSVFPAGTLTGVPKVRAMQLIDKYEQEKRGLYGGAIGYIFQDKFDFAIAIRMAIKDKEKDIIRLQSGAGIVNLSIPEKEYQECLTK